MGPWHTREGPRSPQSRKPTLVEEVTGYLVPGTVMNWGEGEVEAPRRESGSAQKGHRGFTGKILEQDLEG